jgi:hypothetical protein
MRLASIVVIFAVRTTIRFDMPGESDLIALHGEAREITRRQPELLAQWFGQNYLRLQLNFGNSHNHDLKRDRLA